MAVNLFRFYESILRDELCYIFQDEEEKMEMSMDILLASYSVSGLKIADSLDFNLRELRCAYLFLFATSHSHMVIEALNKLHEENCTEFLNLIFSASTTHGSFNITSLGGGPGSDPLGILTFLDEKGFLESCPPVKVTVVDEYYGWKSIFEQVMRRFNNGSVRAYFATQDLLLTLSTEIEALLKRTHFLSMVKFVSAISGDPYRAVSCFQRIFTLLQPGAVVLIIDNAGGPDFNQALTMAKTMGLRPIMEPILHHQFKVPKMQEQGMGRMQYGKRPQSSSTISITILKKYGSSLSNRIEPNIRFEEPKLWQVRTERSNGYNTESSRCSNSSFGPLPPILNRLLLASEYNNRSKASSRSNGISTSSTSNYVASNCQLSTQDQTNISSPSSLYGVNRANSVSSRPKPSGSAHSVFNYQPSIQSTVNTPSTSSLYEINRTHSASSQPKPSGSSYSGLNYQFSAQSKASTSSTLSSYGINRTYVGNSQARPIDPAYGGLTYQPSTRPKLHTPQTSSLFGINPNQYAHMTTSSRTRPTRKKEESICRLL